MLFIAYHDEQVLKSNFFSRFSDILALPVLRESCKFESNQTQNNN